MRIGLLLPTILASNRYSKDRIFAPKYVAVELANGLVEAGQEVYFYTSSDVISKAKIIAGDKHLTNKPPFYYQFRYRKPAEQKYTTIEIIKRDFEYHLLTLAYKDALSGKLDIIHNYHDFGAHYFNEVTGFPTLYTIHDPLPNDKNTIEYLRYSKFRHHNYISISDSQRKGAIKLNFVATIHHGLNLSNYEFNDKPKNHLIYFGRVLEDKGVDTAIDVAIQLGISLYIATSRSPANREVGYFEEKIIPRIDGKRVILVGYLKEKDKSDFIKSAKAFIFPLRWDEPFGLTVIEAMACGTPVIAYNRGSMSELIKDGITGFLVNPDDGIEGLKKAVQRIDEIDRKKCRAWIEEHFTIKRVVQKHLEVYQKFIRKQS